MTDKTETAQEPEANTASFVVTKEVGNYLIQALVSLMELALARGAIKSDELIALGQIRQQALSVLEDNH